MDSSNQSNPALRDSATNTFYEPRLNTQSLKRRQSGVLRTPAHQSVEIDEADRRQNETKRGNKIDMLDTSWGTSNSWEGNDEKDGDRTAVNSKLNSSANSAYHLPMTDDEKKHVEVESTKTEEETEEPYHVFTLSKKKKLVYIVALAGLFSPLSSNIYFPALGRIATDLRVTATDVNLTITVYMVVQAIAPSIWGPFSDSIGRRPIFVATMLVYLASNIGLATTRNYVGLMVFRGIQAAGSAATISIGAGVIGDIASANERGGMIGVFSGIRMSGQALGPVLGGVITQLVGYRGIFWFLLILGSIVLFLIIFFLPETLRPIAGNGTNRLVGFQRPLIYYFKPQTNVQKEQDPDAPKRRVTVGAMLSPLRFLFEKDVFITLFFGSIVYASWSMVTSTTTNLLQARFGINDFLVGLCFLPNGLGCVIGSTMTGYLMDYDFKKTEREYRIEKNIPEDVKLNAKELEDFPIEKARMRNIWWIVLIFIGTTVAYGYSFHLKTIATPLVLQFFIAYTATAVFTLNSALVIDLYPGKSASATAVNNLMRCSVGALGVGFVELILESLGEDITFLMLGMITLGSAPLLVVEWIYGMKWRTARRLRLKKQEDEKKEMQAEKGRVMDLERKMEELERRIREMEPGPVKVGH